MECKKSQFEALFGLNKPNCGIWNCIKVINLKPREYLRSFKRVTRMINAFGIPLYNFLSYPSKNKNSCLIGGLILLGVYFLI